MIDKLGPAEPAAHSNAHLLAPYFGRDCVCVCVCVLCVCVLCVRVRVLVCRRRRRRGSGWRRTTRFRGGVSVTPGWTEEQCREFGGKGSAGSRMLETGGDSERVPANTGLLKSR